MTKEQQQRIFIPFERLGNAVTEDGFGLGLAIVADTVKAEETIATEKTNLKHSMLSGCSVLAIDNNGTLLDMLHDMYRHCGVKCDTCRSVDELTDRMRAKDYDLLITDLKMPEVNGYEVLELLRQLADHPRCCRHRRRLCGGRRTERERLCRRAIQTLFHKRTAGRYREVHQAE